jgi:hypothetical protein
MELVQERTHTDYLNGAVYTHILDYDTAPEYCVWDSSHSRRLFSVHWIITAQFCHNVEREGRFPNPYTFSAKDLQVPLPRPFASAVSRVGPEEPIPQLSITTERWTKERAGFAGPLRGGGETPLYRWAATWWVWRYEGASS